MNLSSVGARFGCLEIVPGKGTVIHQRFLESERPVLDRSGWDVRLEPGSGGRTPDFKAVLKKGEKPMGELFFRRPAHRNGFQMPLTPEDAQRFVGAILGFMDAEDFRKASGPDSHTFRITG